MKGILELDVRGGKSMMPLGRLFREQEGQNDK
jgi:hypothetical protein